MTQSHLLNCHHEPFGDAFYFGPEKMSRALLHWPAEKIEKAGKAHFTYDFVIRSIQEPREVNCQPVVPSSNCLPRVE